MRPIGWARAHPALMVLGAVMALAAAFTFYETRGQSLYADELSMFAVYRDWNSSLLESQSGHLIATSLVAYKTLWSLFGAESEVPFRIYHVILSLLTAGLFYALARPRIGSWAAIAPTALLLFLGSANELTSTPFGSLAYIAVAIGLGVFLALDRDDRRGDLAACGLLLAGLASYSIILAFVGGAAVMIWLRGAQRRWRQAWIVAVPVLAYLIWRQFGLGEGETNVNIDNLGQLPNSLFTLSAAAVASLTGLFREPGVPSAFSLDWGYPLAVVFAGLVILRIRSGPPPSVRFWGYLSTLGAFWVLIAMNLGPLRDPEASRYQYVGVLLLLLIAVELLPPLKLRSWGAAALATVMAAGLLANVIAMHQAAAGYRSIGNIQRAGLAAIEIAVPSANLDLPALELGSLPVTRDLIFPASDYLDAVDRWGSPAYTEAELAAAYETPREVADAQLVRLLQIATAPVPGAPAGTAAAKGCRVIEPGAAEGADIRVDGGISVIAGREAPAEIRLRRFADAFSVALRPIAAEAAANIEIPPDSSTRPWHVSVSSKAPVTVCLPA